MVLVRRAGWLLALHLFLGSAPVWAGELDEIRAHMEAGRWAEAAAGWDTWLTRYPEDVEGWHQRGLCALQLNDFLAAGPFFEEAIRRDPGYNDKASAAFADAGHRAREADNVDRATALYAKAVYYDKDRAPALGGVLLEASDTMTDEVARTRLVGRAAQWADNEAVQAATLAWYERRWGPARRVFLQMPGWTELVRVKPGDTIRYLALHPFRQRTSTVVRILPQAVNVPLTIVIASEDVGDEGAEMLRLGHHAQPVEALVWVVPGEAH